MKTQIEIVCGTGDSTPQTFEELVNVKLEELSKKFWIISIDVDLKNRDAVIMYAEHGQKNKQPAKQGSSLRSEKENKKKKAQ